MDTDAGLVTDGARYLRRTIRRPRRLGLRFNGERFQNEEEGLAFRFYDPFAAGGQQWQPLRPLPYIGRYGDILAAYELRSDSVFMALESLDPGKLDRLYAEQRWILVGVSAYFGPHCTAGHHWSTPAEPEGSMRLLACPERTIPLRGDLAKV